MWGIQQLKMRPFWLKLQSSVDAIQMWSCQLSHWDCCTLQQRLDFIGYWLLLHNHNQVNTHSAQRPPPRGVFQVLMKVMWLPMVLKKKQHHYILGGVWWLIMTHKLGCQASAGGGCTHSAAVPRSDVVTTNCCRYWTYHEMTTTRLVPPGLLSLYRLHTWPLNQA